MILAVWLVLIGLFVMISVSDQFKDLGQGNYQFAHAIVFTAYGLPRDAYNLFPTAAVIGALLGLGQLAGTSELTALRAVGISRLRLSGSVVATVAILTAILTYSGETLAPWAQGQADHLKVNAKYQNTATDFRYSQLWAREGDTFLSAQSGEEKSGVNGHMALDLHQVRLYRLGQDGRLLSLTVASSAQYRAPQWHLVQGHRDQFSPLGVTRQVFTQMVWPTRLDPAALAAGLVKPRSLSGRELWQSIQYRRRNDLDSRDYEDQYWSRWFYPINVLCLSFAAIPFAFGSLRSGGIGKRLFMGILFALAFWLLQLFFGRVAGALKLDYRIAYALPPVVLLVVAHWLYRRSPETA